MLSEESECEMKHLLGLYHKTNPGLSLKGNILICKQWLGLGGEIRADYFSKHCFLLLVVNIIWTV